MWSKNGYFRQKLTFLNKNAIFEQKCNFWATIAHLFYSKQIFSDFPLNLDIGHQIISDN